MLSSLPLSPPENAITSATITMRTTTILRILRFSFERNNVKGNVSFHYRRIRPAEGRTDFFGILAGIPQRRRHTVP